MIAADPRSVRFPAEFIPALRRSLERDHAPAEVAALLRQTGYETGETIWAAFESHTAAEAGMDDTRLLPAERFWEVLSSFFVELGWGTLDHSPLHPGVAALDSTDWMEAEPGAGLNRPSCHFTTGLLADLLRRVVDEDFAVLEVECRSADNERCRFLIGSPVALEAVYLDLMQGAAYADALSRLA